MGEQGPTFTVFRKRGDGRGSLFLSNQSYVKLRHAGLLDSQRGSAVWGVQSRERVRRAGPEDLLRRARTTVGLRAFPWRSDLLTFLGSRSQRPNRPNQPGRASYQATDAIWWWGQQRPGKPIAASKEAER